MNNVATPDLYCPFPAKLNQYVKQAEEHTNEWVIKLNLLHNEAAYKNFYAAKFFQLAAYFFADAPLEELKIVTDWSSWLFIWDDQCDMFDLGEKPDLLNSYQTRLIEVLKGDEPNITDVPIAWALSDIRRRILLKASPEWFNTFIQVIENYFEGCIWEANNRAQQQIPDVDTYTKKRLDTGGVYSIFKLLEFTQRIFLPETVQENFVVKELGKIANNVICWSNDIFSLPREMKQGDFHNLVLAIKHQHELTLDQSMREAVRMHDAEVQRFLDLELNLPEFGEEIDIQLNHYISGIRYSMGGHLDWYIDTNRYQAKGCLAATEMANPSPKSEITISKSDKNFSKNHSQVGSPNSKKVVSQLANNPLPKLNQVSFAKNSLPKLNEVSSTKNPSPKLNEVSPAKNPSPKLNDISSTKNPSPKLNEVSEVKQ
jgi:5-epi-alpha-selinene synthase